MSPSIENALAMVATLGLLVYLTYVLLKPGKF